MANKGAVYLVGAGPGHPDLITVRGLNLLKTCDAVVYDRLVPLELVASLPLQVERFYVGKISGSHALEQDCINELLVRLASEGKSVVRLKGGDPLIFGRGGEEALYLKERGIGFEIVPGVTAGLAASAYTGIPLTHRGKSVFLLMLTAHESPDKQDLQVPWDWLAKVQGGTLVGYMGVTQLPMVVERLISAGMDPSTPAAMVERGATERQRLVSGSLQDLPQLVDQAKITPPALFIIGDVVDFHRELCWLKAGPLTGKKIMVTRPADQAGEMYRLLREQGAYVMPYPTIATTENVDLQQWIAVENLFRRAKENPDWIVFTSENGVRYFMDQFLQKNDARALAGFLIAAVGVGTSRELSRFGLKPDFLPTKAITETLGRELAAIITENPASVIRVRGNLGDDRIESALQAAGANVFPLHVYNTFTATWDAGLHTHLNRNQPDVIIFTSGSSATGLVEILGVQRAKELTLKALVASIGPATSKIIRELGLEVVIEARNHSVPGIIEAVTDYFKPEKI